MSEENDKEEARTIGSMGEGPLIDEDQTGSQEIEDLDLEEETKEEEESKSPVEDANIFAVRTTANREDQVMGFLTSNADKKDYDVYTVIRPHGMRGYIFMEARDKQVAEKAIEGIPYARGILDKQVEYDEIEHMLEQAKKEINIQKNDIVEIISGAFKREKAKVTRIDKAKGEVVVELLEAAVPIPITLNIDNVKVIRRPGESEEV